MAIVTVRPPAGSAQQGTREVLLSDADKSGYVSIVEDDAAISEVIAAILSDAGYRAV